MGKPLLARAVVDEKGRIVLPRSIRNQLGLGEGSRVNVKIEKERLVVSKDIGPEEFIAEMEGFIRAGSKLPLVDPLSLKRIWEEN